MGVHAIDDALHVLHTGVGCKGKTQRQLVEHDLAREAHTQVGWTELKDEDLIRDVARQLEVSATELWRRRKAGSLVITASAAVELTSTDLAAAAANLEERLGVPVLFLPEMATAADLYQGFGAVVRAFVDRVSWSEPPADEMVVSPVGYFMHRYEQEHAANLAELRRLLEGLGARMGPTFLSGEGTEALARAHAARLLLRLPYAGMTVRELEETSSRAVCAAGLPIGVRATGQWLRRVGAALGVGSSRVKRLLEGRERRLAPRLELARRRLEGRRVAICADTPLAAGWLLLAQELGMEVALLVLLDRSLGGRVELLAQLDAAGGELDPWTRVVESPSLRELRTLAGSSGEKVALDLVVRPDLSLAGTAWTTLPTVEIGFPSSHKHFVYPLPELGFTGALALAQRLMDAVGGAF